SDTVIDVSYVPVIDNTHPKNLSIYQFYYLLGFERIGAPVRFGWNGFGLSVKFRTSDIGKKIVRNPFDLVSGKNGRIGLGAGATYVVRDGGTEVKFAIDASDHGHIVSDDAYGWCDIYFKGTKWENREYPAKVRPLVFGHNYLTRTLIRQLHA